MVLQVEDWVSHPGLFLVGGIWMLIHVALLFLVGYMIRAPYFFLAVGSKANIGGAASAPVVAAAFHPALAAAAAARMITKTGGAAEVIGTRVTALTVNAQ